MTTFKYLSDNMIGALELLRCNHKNLMLGGIACSIIDFLGQCLDYPEVNPERNFFTFIDDFLVMQNPNYGRYKKLLYKDLRCGSAHSVMAKGGVTLSYDPEAAKLHLKIKRRRSDGSLQLWIYSPYFIEDMKQAILGFISRVKATPKLQEKYVNAIQRLKTEGQNNIREFAPQEDLLDVEVIDAHGDIKI